MLICGNRLIQQKITVQTNSLTDIFNEPIYQLYHDSHKEHSLSNKCRNCCIKNICGGGMLAHRFSKNRGFDNPSVYCFDLFLLIKHIQNDLVSRLKDSSIEPLTIQDFNI